MISYDCSAASSKKEDLKGLTNSKTGRTVSKVITYAKEIIILNI